MGNITLSILVFYFRMDIVHSITDSGPDGGAVSAESSPNSECSLGLY